MFRGSKKKSWESHSNPVKIPLKIWEHHQSHWNINQHHQSLWPRTPLGSNSLALHPKESGFENSATFDHSNITYRATNSGSRVLLVLGEHHLVSSLSWVFGVPFEIQKFISECSRYSGKKYAPECKYCQRGGAQWSFLITQTPGGQWNHQPFENWYLKHSKFKMSGFLFFSDLL